MDCEAQPCVYDTNVFFKEGNILYLLGQPLIPHTTQSGHFVNEQNQMSKYSLHRSSSKIVANNCPDILINAHASWACAV